MSRKAAKAELALDGATEIFTRYGYARATMGDIAAKAGMSRPALYLLFPDKEAAFASVIERMDTRKLEEIAVALPAIEGLEQKLLHAALAWGLHGAEMAAAHPDASDLFDLRFPAVRQVYERFERFVAEQIRNAVERSGLSATPEELARTLVYGMRGLREAASSIGEMRRLVTVQVESLARALQAVKQG